MTGPIAGVILAGGRSSRMGGGDKALMRLGGRSMALIAATLLQPQVERLAISTNDGTGRYASLGLPILADTVQGFLGPLAGVLAGMIWARENGYSRLVTVAADTPFFPNDLVHRLADNARPGWITVAQCSDRTHPVFALWPTALEAPLAAFLQSGRKTRVLDFICSQPHAFAMFDVLHLPGQHLDPFFNINTPEDLAEAERIAPLLP